MPVQTAPSAGPPAVRRAHRVGPASSYRAPSVVRLKPGLLHRLAWIFGVR